MLEPLLDRFVSDDEPEPLRCSRVVCPLQIEAVERDAVRHEFCPAFFERDEVELIVGFPVVAYAVARAILEHELRAGRRGAADKQVAGREYDDIRDRIIRDRILGGTRDRKEERSRGDRWKETERMESIHRNDSDPWSRRPMRLPEDNSTRNNQYEKRTTNRPPHAASFGEGFHLTHCTLSADTSKPRVVPCPRGLVRNCAGARLSGMLLRAGKD